MLDSTDSGAGHHSAEVLVLCPVRHIHIIVQSDSTDSGAGHHSAEVLVLCPIRHIDTS